MVPAALPDDEFDAAAIDDALVRREYTNGGVEILSPAEKQLLYDVVRAFVDHDSAVLERIGAYVGGSDPYMWTRDYGRFGEVHLTMPPGDLTSWSVDVMRVDDAPGWSMLVVDMWTVEEGHSDLSLEINLHTDPDTGTISSEFLGLHVM